MKYEFNINLSTANIKQTPLLAQERMQKVVCGTQQFNENIVPRTARKVNFRAFLCPFYKKKEMITYARNEKKER